MLKTTVNFLVKLLRPATSLPIALPMALPMALCIALLATACASNTSVSSDWLDKDAKRAQFESALIVAIAANADSRKSFEQAVAQDLRQPGTEILVSSALMDPKTEVNEEAALSVARQQQADAMIVTRVTKLEIEPVEVGGRSAILAQEQQSGADHVFRRQSGTLFRYDYEEDIEATYVTSEYTTELTTDVYDTASGERVYTIVASANKLETLKDVIDVLSDKIAERLRRDRVIR
jgi:hypothetical protein